MWTRCGVNLHNSGRGRSAAYEFLVFIMMIIYPCVYHIMRPTGTAPPGSVYETLMMSTAFVRSEIRMASFSLIQKLTTVRTTEDG